MNFINAPAVFTYIPGRVIAPYSMALSGSQPIRAIDWNGSNWIVVGHQNLMSTSIDGITWTARASGQANSGLTWIGVVWSGSTFIAMTSSSIASTSPDGVTWTQIATAANTGITQVLKVIKTNNRVYVIGTNSTTSKLVYTEDHGATWVNCPTFSTLTTAGTSNSGAVAYIPSIGKYLAASGYSNNPTQLVSSTDGVNWVRYSPTGITQTAYGINSIASNPAPGGAIVMSQGSTSSATFNPYSIDGGVSYATATTSAMTNCFPYDMKWTGTRFMQVGQDTRIAVSTDGATWTNHPADFSIAWANALNCIGVHPDYCLVATQNGYVIKLVN